MPAVTRAALVRAAFGGMGGSVVKKDSTAGRQFNGDRSCFIGLKRDVVIAIQVSLVIKLF